MKLTDIYEMQQEYPASEYKGFKLYEEDEFEDDNRKIWHTVTGPDGRNLGTLRHTPYQNISPEAFSKYVDFYLAQGRFPGGEDVGQSGNLNNKSIMKLQGRETERG